ncbi:hypothetical protein NB697_002822 [Xanthomonas sacchari]|uniref:peptidase n=1 Tax=Xanthomonas sacchari TaxID=56458 RepID=UPI0031BBFB09|nr:hypothetical protein [Xanthomonas sacchari]MCW0453942.1 hypothetical protein [Xanthomonas sacchari]
MLSPHDAILYTVRPACCQVVTVNPMRMLLLSASLFMGGAAQAANDALAGDAGGDADALERHALPSNSDSSEACGPAMPG